MLKNRNLIIPFIVIGLLLVIPLLLKSTYYINLMSFMLIYALFAMSLDVLVGFLGLGSLGHAAFFGGAAYCAGILNAKVGWDFIPSFIGALIFTILLAALFGLLTTRITGVTFLLVNLALGQVVWGLAYRWYSMTGGDNGLVGISKPEILGISFRSPQAYYYLLFFVVLVCAFILYRFLHSTFGQTLKGIKNSTRRMKALGYNVYWHRYIAYVVSGTFAGVAGIMFAFFNNFVAPTEVHTITSAKAMLMVLLGGSGTLFGPALGGAVVVFLENILSAYTERWVLIMGILYIVVVMAFPGGLNQLYQMIRQLVKKLRSKDLPMSE